MESDFWFVIRWWGALFLVGAAAFPLTKKLFIHWYDYGYLFSKAVGLAAVTYIVYVLGTVKVVPFTSTSIIFALISVFVVGLFVLIGLGGTRGNRGSRGVFIIICEELFFFVALLFWSWVKAHEPSIRGLEKFMDFGFAQSVFNTDYFPASDMWYAGGTINYYYFGHIGMALLTKLSAIDLAVSFNLMLATLFAFCFTMSFSIGAQLFSLSFALKNEKRALLTKREGRKRGMILSGALTAFFVTLAGNMQTLYAFTKGYVGEHVEPFWNLLWTRQELLTNLSEGLNRYWYANATRFIPFTIHEFPSYSFVVSDVHGHVLSLPFVLLAIAMLITLFGNAKDWGKYQISNIQYPIKFQILHSLFLIMFYGFLLGVLLMTNALDGPVYFGLFAILTVFLYKQTFVSIAHWLEKGIVISAVAVMMIITSMPFLLHFSSFVSGLAVNCPPEFLTNTVIGPILFEGVEKCQKSPLWMLYLLWGFFWFCGVAFIVSKLNVQHAKFNITYIFHQWSIALTNTEKILVVCFFFSTGLIIFPEFFYFKDIYPAHFRSNTMFKLGYQAFILFSIVSAYAIVTLFAQFRSRMKNRTMFFIFLAPQLFLISIYPIFSVRSYFNSLKNYEGLYGLLWLQKEYAGDFKAIEWLKKQKTSVQSSSFTIIEADGDSYTDYARFSAFTGIPTIVGWPVHEWLWRGTYDVVAPRREEVKTVYEGNDKRETYAILKKYNVRYVAIGSLERKKFLNLNEPLLRMLGVVVFQSGDTIILEVR